MGTPKDIKTGVLHNPNKEKYIAATTPLSNGVEYIIRKFKKSKNQEQVYLSDVFDFTPAGFLYKDETGMGATTLELQAKRHSIIVEPIKITASSKAHSCQALYVGSQTKYHSDKSVSESKIKQYVNNTSVQFKKIIVVADSLSKVIRAIGPSVFQDYFLLIDEIDSFQIDSTFRRSMEEAVDYYKMFDSKNRALLSATMIEFSDKELKAEPVTIVKYDVPHKREINVLTTVPDSLLGLAADYISDLLQKHPLDKIFVAYNSVTGILRLAEHLQKNGLVKEQDIKVLCSSASKDNVAKYFHELDNDLLPGKINFFTSAYFTGYDLNEKYHLVSISGNMKFMHALSEKRLKQIAGRCRPTVYSETVIHDLHRKDNKVIYDPTEKELIDAAKLQAQALTCVKNQYSKSPVLHMILNDFNKSMMAFLEEKTFKFIREDSNKEYVTSYLNIDAELEGCRVRRDLYTNVDDLYNVLENEGHTVHHQVSGSDSVVDKTITIQELKYKEIDYVIDLLMNTNSSLSTILKGGTLTNYQKQIVLDYQRIYKNVDGPKMLEMMRDYLKMTDRRKYKNFIVSARVQALPKGNLFIDRLDFHFPVQKKRGKVNNDEKLSADTIKLRMDQFMAELNYSTPPKDARAAVKQLGLYREISKRSDKKNGTYFVITGENPLNVPITKKNPSVMAEKMYTTFFSYL